MILKLPLPPHPDLDHYRKRAKDLVNAAATADPGTIRQWIAAWLAVLAQHLGHSIADAKPREFAGVVAHLEARIRTLMSAAAARGSTLAVSDAQFFLATVHGFADWSEMAAEINRLNTSDPATREFESAVDAVVTGDLSALDAFLARNSAIVRARSHRAHQATLLHYVAANGVEDYRQRTPPNAVDVATRLLDAGADVDALAKTYSGGWWETPMNLLVSSAHPAGAGLQGALAELLIDRGAAIDGLRNDESPLMTALDFGYGDTAGTLVRRGARVDTVSSAAALGRLDLVNAMVVSRDIVRGDVPLVAPPWRKLPNEPGPHLELALVWACKFRRVPVAEYLLDLGVNPAAADGYKMTPLHWAAANGVLSLMDRLLDLSAPLEMENIWEGTVLDSTAYFADHQPVAGVDYAAVLDRLVAAGAKLAVFGSAPTGSAIVDALLARHGR